MLPVSNYIGYAATSLLPTQGSSFSQWLDEPYYGTYVSVGAKTGCMFVSASSKYNGINTNTPPTLTFNTDYANGSGSPMPVGSSLLSGTPNDISDLTIIYELVYIYLTFPTNL